MPTLQKSLGVVLATVVTALLHLHHTVHLYGATDLAIILNIGMDVNGNTVISVRVAQREETTGEARRRQTR